MEAPQAQGARAPVTLVSNPNAPPPPTPLSSASGNPTDAEIPTVLVQEEGWDPWGNWTKLSKFQRSRMDPSKIRCLCCGLYGHPKAKCNLKHEECQNCKEVGHVPFTCKHPIQCTSRVENHVRPCSRKSRGHLARRGAVRHAHDSESLRTSKAKVALAHTEAPHPHED